MEQSRHYMKSAISPDPSKIGRRQPPTFKKNHRPPPTMKELALNFTLSWNSYEQYVEELKKERCGLNLVTITSTNPETGEMFNETITQRELDARNAFSHFYDIISTEGELPTYDELMLDSDEEESDYDSDEWQNA